MKNPLGTSVMTVVAGAFVLATATLAFADEMLIIDPVTGEATFFTARASERYLRAQQIDAGTQPEAKGYRVELDDAAPAVYLLTRCAAAA